jgi:hypothetical protein
MIVAVAIKNTVLVALLVLIAHFLIKNQEQRSAPARGAGAAPPHAPREPAPAAYEASGRAGAVGYAVEGSIKSAAEVMEDEARLDSYVFGEGELDGATGPVPSGNGGAGRGRSVVREGDAVPQNSTQYAVVTEWSKESTLNGAPFDDKNLMPFDDAQDSYSAAAGIF